MAEVRLELGAFKGLDLYSSPSLMQSGYSPKCKNVVFDAGELRSCKGFERIGDKSGCVRFFNHYKSDGSIVRLAFRGGNIENFDTGSVLKSGFYQATDEISMVNYQMNSNYITVICNGRTAPVKFNGTAVSNLGGSPPNAAFVDLHNERLFMAGNSANPDRIYYSDAFNPESWNAEIDSGYIDLPSWDGGRIKEIKSLFGDLVVFKDYGLYRIYGTYPGEFGVEKISSNVGCVARGTIAVSGEACFFINEKGLCVYDGMSAKPVSDKRMEAVFERVDFNRINEARCFDYSGVLYMFLPCNDGDFVIEYDYSAGTIVKKQGFSVKNFFADKNGLYIIDGNGRVCEYGVGNSFDGGAIDCLWRSKEFEVDGSGTMKAVYSVAFKAKGSGLIKVRILADGKTAEKVVELGNDFSYYRVPVRNRGRSVSVEIANASGSRFEILGICLYMDVEEE